MTANLPFEIPGSGGEPIRGDVCGARPGARAVVVCIHGFKGFRRWGFWPPLSDALTSYGVPSVRYDASHNGVGAGGLDFDRPDLFERNTVAREEEDLATVLGALRSGRLHAGLGSSSARLILLGHSRGGGLAVVHAAHDPGVAGVVALAPVATSQRFTQEQLAEARRRGFLPIVNTRTGEILRMGREAVEEIEARTDLHDIALSHATRLRSPLLVVHGGADTSVAPDEGRRLAEAAPRGRFVPLPGEDHVLGCRHPWEGATPAFERFVGLLRAFVDEVAPPDGA